MTTPDMNTLVVLVFSVGSGPPCVPQVVITGQEAPSTDKGLREDLCKKVMSGDPVAARLPYVVTEMTFPSSVRRSLIIN